MSPQALGEYLGIELTRYQDENPARCALSDYSGQYVETDGHIIALNLYGRELTKPPGDWLPLLPHLRFLNLAKCGLRSCDLREVSPELQVLFLQGNTELTKIQLPAKFPALLRADLSHCGLQTVDWPASPVLEILNASRQQDQSLTAWTFARACPRLYYCDLSHNALPSFGLPAGFANLAFLCLEDNQLSQVKLAGELPFLESLRLSNNQLKTVPAVWLDAAPNLLNLFLDDNEIEERYLTFIDGKSPYEAVTALRDVFLNEALGTARNNECKVLLIGNGKAGKSCIVHRLKKDEFKADWDSTHGIELFSYPLGEWLLHFWDFGGQDIYHATHRLFMQSNVVYLLVWSKESDPRVNPTLNTPGDTDHPYRNYSLDYWLHYADLLGKDSPIILIQTHKEDGVERRLQDIPLLDTLEPEPVIHQIESSWKPPENGYPEMLRYIKEAVQRLKAAEGDRAATNILAMRHWLRQQKKRGKKVLSVDAYLVKAQKLKISGARDVLASWLHKTGVLFYDAERTGDRIILDQEWAIEAIYTLFDRHKPHFERIRSKGGVFTAWELQQIWRDWPQADPELFLAFMLSCEVCFEIPLGEQVPANRSYLAPGLLPERKPAEEEAFWGDKPYWEVHYRFSVLHYGMVQQLLVQTHRVARLQRMTETSTTLMHQGMVATLVAEREREHLNYVVVRVGRTDFPLLASIEELLLDLQPEKPERFLRDPDSQRLVPWQRVQAAFERNIAEIECTDGHYVSRERFADFYAGTLGETAAEDDTADVRGAGRKSAAPGELVRLARKPFDPEVLVAQGALPSPAPAQAPSATAEKTILFIAANPLETAKLQLSDEFCHIYRALKDQSYYDFYPLVQPSMSEVVNTVFERRPHIIHFSGHGTDEKQKKTLSQSLRVDSLEAAGLIFLDESRRHELVVKTEVLKRQFENYLEEVPLELVVFNACHSHHHARAISELGLTVVGTSTEIADGAAINLATGLYRVLATQGRLDEAIRRGVTIAEPYGLDNTQVQVYRDGKLIYGS